jgi:hypothetical protein
LTARTRPYSRGVGSLVDQAALAGASVWAKTPDESVGLCEAFTEYRTELTDEENP